ncbi:hypothetical protein D1013_19610 [Euzebyella marina]|uniref:Uncharacterized protein n=1 Tax=Euzebyella marina TaxID=1761453 RepID=A0A3G2LAZ1_9FLAO|nr:hypothetical protein [Euzebyella marina]AYN69432.1 hypothetical protein D1013_19610 [Euzebyella marina]
MAKEKLVLLKEADLTNNCPECFNQDLKLSFYQKHYHTKFARRTSNEITHELICNKCKCHIYPVSWTEDIERTFDYYQKMVRPKPSSLNLTTLFWVLLFVLIAVVGIGVYLLIQQEIV